MCIRKCFRKWEKCLCQINYIFISLSDSLVLATLSPIVQWPLNKFFAFSCSEQNEWMVNDWTSPMSHATLQAIIVMYVGLLVCMILISSHTVISSINRYDICTWSVICVLINSFRSSFNALIEPVGRSITQLVLHNEMEL